MPGIEDGAGAREVVRRALVGEGARGLKVAGLLAKAPVGSLEIVVDRAEEPRAALVRMQRFWSTWAREVDDLRVALGELDWGAAQSFAGVREGLVPAIAERAAIAWNGPCTQYWLPGGAGREEGAEGKDGGAGERGEEGGAFPSVGAARAATAAGAGDGGGLRRLRAEDVERVLTWWPYGEVESEADRAYVRGLIEQNDSVGFEVDGELVSWALVGEDGSMGLFHTLEAHRRKGIGARVTAALVRALRARGEIPYCYVVETNAGPRALLARFGFEAAEERYCWLGTEGKGA